MKKIKVKIKIEKSYEGYCDLETVLVCLGMTEEKWNSLTQEQQESLLYDYYEDEICDFDRNYDYMDYCVEIKK